MSEQYPQLVDKINRWAMHKISQLQYRNLVFKGGGVRGVAYLGALQELERLGFTEKLQRVAGSSVGAIAALMVSLRLPASKVKAIFDTLDFSRIPQARPDSQPESLLTRVDLAACSQRLFKGFGWYSSEYFYQWLQEVISLYSQGKPMATFADFKQAGHRGLHVVVSNLTQRRSEVMSAETTPDVAVADAVRMSMSIPLYFEALRFDGQRFGEGDLYVDGGLFDNYPLHVFDQPKLVKRNPFVRQGVNWQTLGMYLYAEKGKAKPKSEETRSLIEFINLLLENLYASHQLTAYEPNPLDQRRTIQIGDCGVSATHFNITPGGPDYEALYQSGQKAVQAFFASEYAIAHHISQE